MNNKVALLIGAVSLMAGAHNAFAGQATANVPVSATVANSCVVSTASPTFAFGAYDPVSANAAANLDTSTTVDIKCTKSSTGVSVGFGNGLNYDGTGLTRRLSDGGGTPVYLSYDLYRPSGVGSGATCPYTATWGSVIGTDTLAVGSANFTTSSTAVTVRVCGRVFSAQDVAPNTYNDTVQLQVNF